MAGQSLAVLIWAPENRSSVGACDSFDMACGERSAPLFMFGAKVGQWRTVWQGRNWKPEQVFLNFGERWLQVRDIFLALSSSGIGSVRCDR